MKRKPGSTSFHLAGMLFCLFAAFGLLPAAITVTFPTNHISNGQSYMINWMADSPKSGNVRIELRSMISSATVLTISSSYPNSGRFRWMIPTDLASFPYRIRIVFLTSGQYGDSDQFHVFPYVGFTSPNGLVQWRRGKTYTFTWSWIGPSPKSGLVRLFTKAIGNDSAPEISIDPAAPNTGTYAWKIPSSCPLGKRRIFLSYITPTNSSGLVSSSANIDILPALQMVGSAIPKSN